MNSLILASTSPRRKKILSFLGVPFKAVPPRGVLEAAKPGESPQSLVRRLALEKARSLRAAYPRRWILGSDTLVAQGKRVYGKPQSRAEAAGVLRALSGKRHSVLTGFALVGPGGKVFAGVGESGVYFRVLSRKEIDRYTRSAEPYDKAGGYDIRGTAGQWVRRLQGDFFTVMGLPLPELLAALARAGFRAL